MEPRDLDVTLMSQVGAQSGQDMSSHHPGMANGLFADGSVRTLSDNIDPQVVRGMTTIAGGEAIGSGF